MRKARELRIGGLAPAYDFIMNPYPGLRLSKCPFCEHRTGQLKVPLLIHIDGAVPIALNYTCRYCRSCDLLVAHKHEVEHLLHGLFSQMNPEIIGNEYFVLGTVERRAWRAGLHRPQSAAEVLPQTHDFRRHFPELRMTCGGWFSRGQEPPVAEPPASREWFKKTR